MLAFERDQGWGAELVVMPEALLGGYPKGENFGTRLGYRTPEGRENSRLITQMRSISAGREVAGARRPGSEAARRSWSAWSSGTARTLYCTALFFEPRGPRRASTAS